MGCAVFYTPWLLSILPFFNILPRAQIRLNKGQSKTVSLNYLYTVINRSGTFVFYFVADKTSRI